METTIRVYMINGHHAAGVRHSFTGFQGLCRDAEAHPGRFVNFTDGTGFRWAVRPENISHIIENKD